MKIKSDPKDFNFTPESTMEKPADLQPNEEIEAEKENQEPSKQGQLKSKKYNRKLPLKSEHTR